MAEVEEERGENGGGSAGRRCVTSYPSPLSHVPAASASRSGTSSSSSPWHSSTGGLPGPAVRNYGCSTHR